MNIEVIWFIILVITSAVLVFLYTGILVAIGRGFIYKKVMIMTILLLASNIAMLIVVASEIYTGRAIVADDKKTFISWVIVNQVF